MPRIVAEQSKEPQKVFVYGTLKKGYGNHGHHLADAMDCGAAALEGIMFHLGGFPAINVDEAFCHIAGEVYQTDWDHIYNMDRLEGVGQKFYDRVQVKVSPHGTVWTYVFSRERVIERDEKWVIPSGIWRGSMTPKVRWAGFGKGIEIGSFETIPVTSTLKVGPGTGNFGVRKEGSKYVLFHKFEGSVLGEYNTLRDFLQNSKPVLRLKPDVSVVKSGSEGTVTNHPTIKDIVESRVSRIREQNNDHLPILLTADSKKDPVIVEPKKIEIPQAMRLLQVKYGAA